MEEIGKVTVAMTKFLKTMYLYHSTRKLGHVYEFTWRRGDYYRCAQCKKLGKMRTIVIRDDTVVVGDKHPEDDHHPNCQPLLEIGTLHFTCCMYNLQSQC